MDLAFSAIIGAIVFVAFTAGLAESINTPPFYVIVGLVIVLMGLDTFQTFKEQINRRKSNKK